MAESRARSVRVIDSDLRAIGALTQAMLDGEDLEQLLSRVAREARTLVGAISGVVVTVAGSPEMITFRAVDGRTVGPLRIGFTMPVSETLTELALQQGTNVVARNAGEIPASGRAFAVATGIGPLIAAPLSTVGSARGVLVVGKADGSAPFRPTEIALVSAFAAQAACAIELFELRDAETVMALRLERERIARDLHDGVIQSLFGLGMALRTMVDHTTDNQVTSGLQQAVTDLDEAIAIVRAYIADLGGPQSLGGHRPPRRMPTPTSSVATRRRIIESRSSPDVISSIGELARTMASNRPANEVLQSLVEGAVEEANAEFGLVSALAPDGASVLIRATAGPEIRARGVGDAIPIRETLAGEAIRLGRPLTYSSMEHVTVALPSDIRRTLGPVAAVPLAVRGQSFGALLIGRRPGAKAFSRPDVQLIGAYAVQAAIALEFDRVRQVLDRKSVSAERDRIGRVLHDRVIQLLFSVGMAVQALESAAQAASMRTSLRSIVDDLDRAIRDLRRYVYDIGPSLISDRRLREELEALAGSLAAGSNLQLRVDIDPAVSTALEASGSEVVQIVREALSNVVRHARANRCSLRLVKVDGRILLEVTDDGRGLEASATTDDGHGHGLANMRARAAALGADVEIRSLKGEGTRVRVLISS